jgi:hypothetical protein
LNRSRFGIRHDLQSGNCKRGHTTHGRPLLLRRNDTNGTERAGDGLDFEYFESNLQIQR